MRKLFLILCFVLVGFPILAQTHQQANKAFQAEKYEEAQAMYGKLLKRYSTEALYLYRYARCAYELNDYATAFKYFHKSGNRYPLRFFYEGEMYMRQFLFEQAIHAYTLYLSTLDSTSERYSYVQDQLAYAKKGATYMRRVQDIAIVDSVVLPKDSFLYAFKMGRDCGQLTDSAGYVTFTNQRNDRRIQGGQVLTSLHRLLDGWIVDDTISLEIGGNINYPFVLADGVTLYFASDDPKGLGGYDIYMTRYNAEKKNYAIPYNVGFPFNSSSNDYMMAIDENQRLGWFVTDRFTGASSVAVYTFIPNEEVRILRDVDSTSLALAAQLKSYRRVVVHEEEEDAPVTDNVVTFSSHAFSFVVNDELIYHTLSDFQSSRARDLMKEYLFLTEQIIVTQEQLEQDRTVYVNGDKVVQDTLRETILKQENALQTWHEELVQLGKNIRKAELSLID